MSNYTLDMYAESKHHGGPEDPMTAPWHDLDCFDYLRQSIMCCGDTALEGTQNTFPDPSIVGCDGYDSTHVCKKYDRVRDFFDENRAWNIGSIEGVYDFKVLKDRVSQRYADGVKSGRKEYGCH